MCKSIQQDAALSRLQEASKRSRMGETLKVNARIDKNTSPNPASTRQKNRKELQAVEAKEKICQAVITCLDDYGYAETSISRIMGEAKVSRGALTHHFPSKEDLIVATTDHLLQPLTNARSQARSHPKNATFEEALVWIWKRMVSTKEGRAFSEILNAARTDKALQKQISQKLKVWNDAINDRLVADYAAKSESAEDSRMLWSMCRVFVRGLLINDRFGQTQAEQEQLLRKFAQMMAPAIASENSAHEDNKTEDQEDKAST